MKFFGGPKGTLKLWNRYLRPRGGPETYFRVQAARFLAKESEALVGVARSGEATRKPFDLRNTKFNYIRDQKRPFDAQGA